MSDHVLPFSTYSVGQKGRLVFLEANACKVLKQHQYPLIVQHFMLELLGLLCVMGSDSKTKSIVTMQIKADESSPISLLVADLEYDGGIRAFARFNEELLKNCTSETPIQDIFKNGCFVFTVDFEKDNNRYQAIVDLKGRTLTESMSHYCRQSDQIPTALHVFVNHKEITQNKRLVAALMLQQLPLDEHLLPEKREEKIEEWVRSVNFMNTLSDKEALDDGISSDILLKRLFHDSDLAVYDKKPLFFKCRCSLEKVEQVLLSIRDEERESLKIDGKIQVDCEFCGRIYEQDERKEIKIANKAH